MRLYIIDESEAGPFNELLSGKLAQPLSIDVNDVERATKLLKLSFADKRVVMALSKVHDVQSGSTQIYLCVLKHRTDFDIYLSGLATLSKHSDQSWHAILPDELKKYVALLTPYEVLDQRKLFPKAPAVAATPAPSKPGTPVGAAHGGTGQRAPSFAQAVLRGDSLTKQSAATSSHSSVGTVNATVEAGPASATTAPTVATTTIAPTTEERSKVTRVDDLLEGITPQLKASAATTKVSAASDAELEPRTPVLNLPATAARTVGSDSEKVPAGPRLSQMHGSVITEPSRVAASKGDDVRQPLLKKDSRRTLKDYNASGLPTQEPKQEKSTSCCIIQ